MALRLQIPSHPHGMAARLAFGVDRVLFNGHLAVVVFFLLSGYVIHLPHARGKTLRPVEFWVRRLLRILLPLAVAMGLSLACRTPGRIGSGHSYSGAASAGIGAVDTGELAG